MKLSESEKTQDSQQPENEKKQIVPHSAGVDFSKPLQGLHYSLCQEGQKVLRIGKVSASGAKEFGKAQKKPEPYAQRKKGAHKGRGIPECPGKCRKKGYVSGKNA